MRAQLDDAPLPARVQLEGLNFPVPVLVKETVPVGVTRVPVAVSVTLAVHEEEEPACREEGEHVTLVEVVRAMIC